MKKNALDLYSDLIQRREHFRETNADIFAEFEAIEAEVKVAEENVKAVVRDAGVEVANDRYIAKPILTFKKWFDWKTVKKLATDAELVTIERDAIESVDLNPKIMQELVMSGKIRPAVVQKSFRQEPMTTRVTISAIK